MVYIFNDLRRVNKSPPTDEEIRILGESLLQRVRDKIKKDKKNKKNGFESN